MISTCTTKMQTDIATSKRYPA